MKYIVYVLLIAVSVFSVCHVITITGSPNTNPTVYSGGKYKVVLFVPTGPSDLSNPVKEWTATYVYVKNNGHGYITSNGKNIDIFGTFSIEEEE